MNIIAKLLNLSNKVDKKSSELADKLERFSANAIDTYVPQNVLEQGWKATGGGNLDGSLGGYHVQMNLSGNANYDSQAIAEASKFLGELDSELPMFEQWQQSHPNLLTNPYQVYNILQVWQPFYMSGIRDLGKLQSVLGMSGPIDLQFATQSPSSDFQYFDITPNEIMEHERAHASGKTSTKEEYLQRINPNADILNTQGFGGNINPRYKAYQFMQSFTGDKEYGPNLHILDRLLKSS